MPSIQIIYASVSTLRYSGKILDELVRELKSIGKVHKEINKENIQFTRKISLNNVSYNYPGTDRTVLHDLSLTIKANSLVGFVGLTGSGKTTLIDIILGLLEPKSGHLIIDDINIDSTNIN